MLLDIKDLFHGTIDVKAMQEAIDYISSNYTSISVRCCELAQGFAWPKVTSLYKALYDDNF